MMKGAEEEGCQGEADEFVEEGIEEGEGVWAASCEVYDVFEGVAGCDEVACFEEGEC